MEKNTRTQEGLLVTVLATHDQRFVDQLIALLDENDSESNECEDENPRPTKRRRVRGEPYLVEILVPQVQAMYLDDDGDAGDQVQRPQRVAKNAAALRLAQQQYNVLEKEHQLSQ
ncbi:MAG: hypothetical protein MHM6MM_004504 [Cercozoa sp. M6MM]